jgi:PAS domain S-box-containing protein
MVLFEGIQQILWVLRPDGSVERFNPYWTTYTGLPQQMEALTWADVFHPDDRARLVEVRTRGVAEEKPYVVDARMRRADGAYRWHRCQVTPLFKDGRLTAWIGTALDIEDLRQAEFKAQESERQKRIVLETINEGYYRLDREWRFVDVNHVFEAMSGKSREEILGQRVWDIFPDAQGASDYEAVASDEPAAVYERYSRPIGRWFEVTVSRSEDGVETYFRDIDDRKRAEARQAALVDLGDRLRELTAATDADVAELAAATIGKTLALLRVGYAVTSIDDDTAVVERDWVTDPEVARSAGTYRVSEWGSYLDPLRRGETVLIDNVRGDPRTLAAAEGWVAWDTQAAAFVPLMQDGQLSAYMFLHAGTPHRWTNDEVGFVSNVLDRAWAAVRRLRADAAVRELNANLETLVEERTRALLAAEEQLRQAQKMEAIGQLTGGVAHDFNNLLTIVRSSVDFLRRPNLPEERRVRYIDAITDTVSRAAKLTGQLLAFARRQALKPEVFDVAERIHAVTDMLRTIVGARIEIVTDIACRRCFVEADASQFETALINIAVNARDAMDGEGRLTLAVKIHSTLPPLRRHGGSPGRFVAVSLTDTGCGIPADKLPHVFEPFFTTKEVGKGTGLGLSQVYGFAKQSGGDVAVESKVGHGTSLTLFLPQVDTEPGEIETVSDSLAPEDGRGRRVLLVEDNKDVGAFSTQLLQDLGYETRWAANAAEALQILEDDSDVDAVFSDVVMPGMSGIELGREIRRRWPRLPVVLTSGYSHVLAEEGRHGFELLQKPYAADELSRTLRQVMRRT